MAGGPVYYSGTYLWIGFDAFYSAAINKNMPVNQLGPKWRSLHDLVYCMDLGSSVAVRAPSGDDKSLLSVWHRCRLRPGTESVSHSSAPHPARLLCCRVCQIISLGSRFRTGLGRTEFSVTGALFWCLQCRIWRLALVKFTAADWVTMWCAWVARK